MARSYAKNCDGQIPLFIPPTVWKPTPVNKLPAWAGAKRVAIDIETFDPLLKELGPGVRRGAKICGISFAIEDGPADYIPIGHPEDNVPREHAIAYLQDQFKTFDGDIVGANLPYDLDFLWEAGVAMPKVKSYLDIQVAEPLIDELQLSYSLDSIAKRRGLPGKDESTLRDAAHCFGVDPKKGLWQIPGRFVAEYAIQDVRLPLQILRRQERDIEDQDLTQIWELERKLVPILLKMRRRGVAIDFKQLNKIEDWSIEQQRFELAKVKELTGVTLGFEELNTTAALVKPLQTIANIKFLTGTERGKKSNNISIDKEFLQALRHPVADAILRAKKMEKVRNTFVASVRKHEVNGRVHSTFNQLRRSSDDSRDDDTGARYGRLSSTDLNIQQQPARDPEIGKEWRKVYIPDDGKLWAACDYSQQEPRMTIHFAVLAACTGAIQMMEKFCTDLSADNHTEMTKIVYGEEALKDKNFKKLRGYCKEIFLGLCYGMGGAKLCRKIGKPTKWIKSERMGRMVEVAGPEGQAVLDQFNDKVPYVGQLAKIAEKRARERGYIRTLLGRVCRFPKKKDGTGYDWCHKALNRVIQGSSADQTKAAVIAVDEAGHELQLQVHDELDLSVRDRAHAEEVGDIMRTCSPIKVPSKVDVEIGDSWGASMG